MSIRRIDPNLFPQSPAWVHIPPSVVPAPREGKEIEFAPKKAGTKTAHVVFILDDSGSMQTCRQATIDGFNEFLEGQRENDVETFVSLYKFDGSSVNCVFDHVPLRTVKPLTEKTYNPRGSTNLLDAMGDVMFKVNGRLVNHAKKNRDSITIVALTDGAENSSTSYMNTDIKSMVERAEAKEWSFMFLGANIDAFSAGSSMGFSSHNTLQYSTNNMGATMKAASRMTRDMTSLKAAGVSNTMAYASATYTDDERTEAGK